MGAANAWLLHLGNRLLAAVGEFELVHVVLDSPLFRVPLCPPHCNRLLLWEGRLLPVMDLSRWLLEGDDEPKRYMAILPWRQGQEENLYYGALPLVVPPTRIQVRDEAACSLPQSPLAWRSCSLSCFLYGDRPVPILDVSGIFGRRPGAMFETGAASPTLA